LKHAKDHVERNGFPLEIFDNLHTITIDFDYKIHDSIMEVFGSRSIVSVCELHAMKKIKATGSRHGVNSKDAWLMYQQLLKMFTLEKE
jgi:hypothetical protein